MNLKNKIINLLTKNGKKQKSEKMFFKSIKSIQKTTKKNSYELIKLAVINATPSIELKEIKRKRRKTKRYLPYVLNNKNRTQKALKTIIKHSAAETKKPIWVNLKSTLMSVMELENQIQKNNAEKHKKAILKKKFTKFRWFF